MAWGFTAQLPPVLFLLTFCGYIPSEPTVAFCTPGRRLGCKVTLFLYCPHLMFPSATFCCQKEFASRDGALGQELCSKMEMELEGATNAGLSQRGQGCRLLLCIAGTNSEKQQVAWHTHILFLVLISRSFIGKSL